MLSLARLVRTNNWWNYKIPPMLALGYAAILLYGVPLDGALRALGLAVLFGLAAGSYGHVVNDLFDLESDRLSGRPSYLDSLAPWQRHAAWVLPLALGFAPALWLPFSRSSLVLLAIEYLLPTVYSLPPIRLKQRGAAGVLCDALGAHVVPGLYTISMVAAQAGPAGQGLRGFLFPLAAAVWALCLGLKAIVIHEFRDRHRDRAAGIATFATGLDFARVRLLIERLYRGELAAFAFLLAVLFPRSVPTALAALLYAAMVGYKVRRRWAYFVQDGGEAAAVARWHFSHAVYECYFPLVAAVQCAWRLPWLAALPVLQVALFPDPVRWQVREFRLLAGDLRERLSRYLRPRLAGLARRVRPHA
jgi:4-hydroxybenzoate polyprenyltransferase